MNQEQNQSQCCNNTENTEKSCPSHGGNHGIMMIICCLGMLLAFMILPRFGRPFSLLAVLICPLMHLFMLKSLFTKKN